MVTLGIAIGATIGFDPGEGMQYVVDVDWIPGLGVSYSLGIDGLSVWLVLLTAIAWVPATVFAAMEPDAPAST